MTDTELTSLLTTLPTLERRANLGAVSNVSVPFAARDLLAFCEAVRVWAKTGA